MPTPTADNRTPRRTLDDERLSAAAALSPPSLPPDAAPSPVETHLKPRRHPVAVEGVVENGLVRPLDPDVKLAEHSRVIIVASQ